MKTIYFIRHAKSDWSNTGLTDIDRPLNMRGYGDAHKMSLILKEQHIFPDLIITSPAIRAVSTALIFGRNLTFDLSKLIIDKNLYATGVDDYINCVRSITPANKTVFLFGHNPLISDCVNSFTNAFTGELSTCSIVGLAFTGNDWKNFNVKNVAFTYYNYPKNNIKNGEGKY